MLNLEIIILILIKEGNYFIVEGIGCHFITTIKLKLSTDKQSKKEFQVRIFVGM